MSFGSVFGSIAGNVASGYLDHVLALRRQKQAQGFEADMFQQRYQMTIRDLQAAGLNPMLAYTNGVGSAPSSSAAGSSGTAHLGSEAVAADNTTRIATAQVALLRAQKKQAEAQTVQTSAQTEKTNKESDIKGPRAVIMRAVEDVLEGYLGNSAESKAKATQRTKVRANSMVSPDQKSWLDKANQFLGLKPRKRGK